MQKTTKRKIVKLVNYVYLSALLIGPLVLFILPADAFDHGEKSLCLSVIILGKTCPACGMTRAIQHLLHFDFQTAMDFNKLSVFVLPVLIVAWFLEVKRTVKVLFLEDKQ